MEERIEYDPSTLAEAARLFNRLGYTVSSLDLVERQLRIQPAPEGADGERLARAAFDYAAGVTDRLLEDAIAAEETTIGQLGAVIHSFRRFVVDPPLEGGSPVFHAAVRSHQAFGFLEERARDIVSGWRHLVRRIVRRGIKLGEIRPSAQPEAVASIIVGTMEGAIFLHRIYRSTSHVDRSVDYLLDFVERDLAA